jgi:hypothetical protein
MDIHPLLNDQTFLNFLNDYDMTLEEFYTCIAFFGLNGTVGQANFLNNPTNAANYNLSYFDDLQQTVLNDNINRPCDEYHN